MGQKLVVRVRKKEERECTWGENSIMRLTDYQDYYSRSEMEHFIDEFIFNERNRNILKRHLLDGLLIKELSYEFNLDYDYLRKNLIPKECDKLFRRIERWEKKQNKNA